MGKMLLAIGLIAFVASGCVTTPPSGAITKSATPIPYGPESGYTGYGMFGAHEWTDDDARTALWSRRNLPERWNEIPLPMIKFFSYNIHHDRQQLSPFEWDYYFADINDPYLQVRMFTIEARDRNNTRRQEILAKQEAEKAAAEKAITEDVAELSDQEVSKKLQTIFP
jgi:hypothetical protein